MIQRIQSVYLLIATLVSGVLIFFFNLWEVNEKQVWTIDLLNDNLLLMKSIPISFLSSTLITFVTIFQFKNRKLQFVLGRISILINLFLLVVLIYLSLTLSGEAKVSEKGIGMFLPIVVILFVVLANKAIKKDEDLVKSVDRLR